MTRTLGRSSMLVGLVLISVFLSFRGVGDLYFAIDDFEWIRASREATLVPGFSLPANVNGHFRPLAEALWLLEYISFGLDARPYHLVAIALHAVASIAVGLVAWSLVGRFSAAVIASLLFAINIAHRAAPTWISSSPDLLLGVMAAVCLAGLLARGGWRWIGLLGFAGALMAKESGLILIVIVPLVAWPAVRKGLLRWALLAIFVTLLVPHLIALGLSSYVQARFRVGVHVASHFLEALSALVLPPTSFAHDAIPGWLVQSSSPIRVALGSALVVGVFALATRCLGAGTSFRWFVALLASLLLPALATDLVETRWLYLPWVLLAPVAAAALVAVRDRLATSAGNRVAAGVVVCALLGHVTVHGAAISLKIDADLRRDSWVRGIVEGAGRHPPTLRDHDVVEVIVPFGSELRFWPVGLELALDRELDIRPIDDRTAPDPGTATLDATTVPARWR